jgi:arylsulfatase A-like enzyme
MPDPNILVLLTDQQQARTIESSTECRMDNVDRLASEGTRFSRAYTANPVCSPSRASFLTGLLPHSHGMVDVAHNVEPYRAEFRDELDTWSRRLADAGYTLGYFGKWHVERSNELERFGFDEYDVFRGEEFDEGYERYRESLGLDPDVDLRSLYGWDDFDDPPLSMARTVEHEGYKNLLVYGTHTEPPEGMRDYYVYDQGVDFVRDHADGEPWCLTISTDGPHDPYLVPEEYYERYDPGEFERPPNFDDNLEDKPVAYRNHQRVWHDLGWDEFAEAMAYYYAYCTFIDDQIGRVLDALEETEQLENTVVVFASDHGDQMGAHRLFLKGTFSFEKSYRIPMIVRHPDGVEGQVLDDIVQLHDLGATLPDLAGDDPFPERMAVPVENPIASASGEPIDTDIADMSTFRATSLVPFLHGDRPENHRQEAFAEFHGVRFFTTQRIVWDDRYKYVFNANDRDELYDLEHDPHEQTNLVASPDHQEIKEQLAARMWEIIDETGDYTMANTDYGMFRYAPIGPHEDER